MRLQDDRLWRGVRRILHLLLVFAVLLCGSQLAEPAEAAVDVGHAGQCLVGAADDCDDAGKVPDAGHHHCPVAPDPAFPAIRAEFPLGEAIVPFLPVAVLHSLSRAPPLDPPTA